MDDLSLFKFGSFLIFGFAAFIGIYVQLANLYNNDSKIRIELFDRRYNMKSIIDDFLRSFLGAEKASFKDIIIFRVEISKSKYLFDSDVHNYLLSLIEEVISISADATRYKPQEDSDLLAQNHFLRVSNFVTETHSRLDELMGPYLNVKTSKRSFIFRITLIFGLFLSFAVYLYLSGIYLS